MCAGGFSVRLWCVCINLLNLIPFTCDLVVVFLFFSVSFWCWFCNGCLRFKIVYRFQSKYLKTVKCGWLAGLMMPLNRFTCVCVCICLKNLRGQLFEITRDAKMLNHEREKSTFHTLHTRTWFKFIYLFVWFELMLMLLLPFLKYVVLFIVAKAMLFSVRVAIYQTLFIRCLVCGSNFTILSKI